MIEKLSDLRVYRKAIELSDMAWHIYQNLPKEHRFHMGSQLLRAVDSIGANIAEGFGRFHYRDKTKFYYNARGSLWECKHWGFLFYKRGFLKEKEFDSFMKSIEKTGKLLNNFIRATGGSDG